MRRIKFVITDYLDADLEYEEEECRQMGIDFAYYQKRNAPSEELIEVCKDADIVLIDMAKFNKEVIYGLKQCKLLLRHGIGYDNVDINACNEVGIAVGYYPRFCITEVAEQAVMLILACQRKLTHQYEKVKNVTANGYKNQMSVMPIHRLSGSTIGIVGFGRIGSLVYKMLQGFGVSFLIFDPYMSEERKREFNIETCSFEELLENSDVITVHVPLKKRFTDTYHMFDAPQFKTMKESAIFINTSRGPVVNIEALNEALDQGEIAQAGLDVLEMEPPSPNYPIIKNPNVVLTPHMSWLSVESVRGISESYMDDVHRFLNKIGPKDQVNPQTQIRFE